MSEKKTESKGKNWKIKKTQKCNKLFETLTGS